MKYHFLKILFNRNAIYYFWIPRLLISVLIIQIYDNLQMIGEGDYVPDSPYIIPDVSAYLNSINFNPLYSINLQLLKYFSLPNIAFTILGELISSYGCLLIFDSSKKYFKFNKFALIFLGAHPILCLYSLKFCTENFGLLGVSLYLNSVFSEINTNKKIEILQVLKTFSFN